MMYLLFEYLERRPGFVEPNVNVPERREVRIGGTHDEAMAEVQRTLARGAKQLRLESRHSWPVHLPRLEFLPMDESYRFA